MLHQTLRFAAAYCARDALIASLLYARAVGHAFRFPLVSRREGHFSPFTLVPSKYFKASISPSHEYNFA